MFTATLRLIVERTQTLRHMYRNRIITEEKCGDIALSLYT